MNIKIAILFAILASISMPTLSGDLTETKKTLTEENKSIENKCTNTEGCTKEEIKKLKENISTLDQISEKFKFGIAIGFENYKNSYINEAELVGSNRTVRVVSSQEKKPSLWLETHYIWDGFADSHWGATHAAPGFYVGARLLGPNSEIFEAFSLGLMYSFKRTAFNAVPKSGQIADSINIGIGPVWHKTKMLATGVTEGSPLPSEYNDIKFNSRDEVSWMLMISAGF
jgi:hypothetical protein